MSDRVTFSFGENWQKYLDAMPASAIERTTNYVNDWLGELDGLSFVDIGSGSGLNATVAAELGAKNVVTFDVDPNSVEATERMRVRSGRGDIWTNGPGSILDDQFVASLGKFDVVSSWGVLHHTGDVWHAIDNASRLVAPGGRLWIALYNRTYATRRSLRTKRLYNRVPIPIKALWRGAYASAKYAKSLLRGEFRPWARYHDERGMDWWRDIEDWLGGLPYEPVGPGEVIALLRTRGLELERLEDALGEGRNNVYLFRSVSSAAPVRKGRASSQAH